MIFRAFRLPFENGIHFLEKTCNEYAKNGLPFNPYKEQPREYVQNRQIQPVNSDSSQVVSLGGKSPQNLMYDGYAEAGEQFAARGGVVGSAQ